MESRIVPALREEIASLERELEAHPAWKKLTEAKRLLALYSGEDNKSVAEQAVAIPKTRASRTSPERQKIIEHCQRILLGRRTPTRTAAIFAQLQTEGVNVPGATPQNNLSAMLSNSPLFKSHGRSGWTLAVTEDTEAPDIFPHEKDMSEAPKDSRFDLPVAPPAQGREAGPGGGT